MAKKDYKEIWQEHYDDAKSQNLSESACHLYADTKLAEELADKADYIYAKYKEGAFDA